MKYLIVIITCLFITSCNDENKDQTKVLEDSLQKAMNVKLQDSIIVLNEKIIAIEKELETKIKEIESKVPSDEYIKNDIRKYFKNKSMSIEMYDVRDINVLGKSPTSDGANVHCKAKIKQTLVMLSGSERINDITYDIKIRYTQYGDDWKSYIDYQIIK